MQLTRVLEGANLTRNVLAPYRRVAARMRQKLPDLEFGAMADRELTDFRRFHRRVKTARDVNAMQYFWDILIEDFHCPFIKRGLIQSNPARIPFASRWSEVIAAQSNYDLNMIRHHLNREAIESPAG